MPRPLELADSDSDGEGIALEPEPKDVLTASDTARASTGSTEQISRDIREAERALLEGSGSGSGGEVGEVRVGEFGVSGRKRRVTEEVVAVSGSGSGSGSGSFGKGVKRMKTHGVLSQGEIRDGGAVTLHSSDNLLPAQGTLRADFADHEPMVMFGGDSGGSTAVDGSSEQRRMIGLARSEGRGLETSASRLGETKSEEQRSSSSFPWTASVQTPYGKTPAGIAGEMGLLGTEVHEADRRSPLAPNEHVEAARVSAEEVLDAPLPEEKMVQPDEPTGDTANAIAIATASVSRSCPRVHITLPVEAASSPTKPAPEAPTQKSTRGRKRKIQEPSSEAVTSDDRQLRDDLRAVGLEKERYVPRPSRRRATQALEMPVDFSVAPEKAAKARRVKRSTHVLASPAKVDQSDKRLEEPPAILDVPEQTSKCELATGSEQHDESAAPAVNKLSVKSQVQLMEDEDDDVFIKPMAKPNPKTKARRSHTTIFEDHVSFGASQRTPTLSQQQAKRKNALQVMVDVGVAVANQKRRRTTVQDDEDDEEGAEETPLKSQRKHAKAVPDDEDAEDELTPAPSVDKVDEPEPAFEEVVEEAPKKRGRGRPPKNAPSEPQAAVEVLDEPELDLGKGVVEVEEAPKKPARRQKSTTSNAHTTESTDPELPDGGKETPRTSDEPNLNAGATADPAPARAPATQEPTPSPEKVVKVIKATSLPSKSSPTSHSPLKSSSAVPLRVGLNKLQRIAPLLRSIKPVKR
ncbi:hypothetical protein LTR82_010553 [Friedmanniomyces endolithicus]|uniref:Uncharacterized protein n=1 Tax=Friedmanniomyces endolithicus TaxID=329885 RepID=A0AAN6J6B0_9PEZI|nr:hypothetical protein LTR82_010553 [Friedmanniomyces endolithicus]